MNDRNTIIRNWTTDFLKRLDEEKRALGIKHNRLEPPVKTRAKFKTAQGEIKTIVIVMSKGDVMTHKGKGGNNTNRTPKPWYVPVAETNIPELADQLALEYGDAVCKGLTL